MNTPTMQTYSQTPIDVVRAANGIDFAYRRVGNRGDIPLVLGNYFAANMDDWDPLIVDGLAADRDVITFDYPGIGSSTGATPATVAELADDCIGFLHALGLSTVDFLGFSLGGMVAQQIASSHPHMVRRLILCGTGPRGGEKMTFDELSTDELEDPTALVLKSFFTPSDAGQAAGHACLDRLNRRKGDRDTPVTMTAASGPLPSSPYAMRPVTTVAARQTKRAMTMAPPAGLCPIYRRARPYNKSLKYASATSGPRTKSLKRAWRGPTKPHTTRSTTRTPTT